MKYDQKVKGYWGEEKAKEYLTTRGVEIISQNYYCEYGEIDLIGIHDGMIVFFEVKTRFSKSYGYPEVSINFQKSDHIKKCSLKYLQNHPEIDSEWRIDVISITKYENERLDIRWLKNAISE